jgi:hypothetical protein
MIFFSGGRFGGNIFEQGRERERKRDKRLAENRGFVCTPTFSFSQVMHLWI